MCGSVYDSAQAFPPNLCRSFGFVFVCKELSKTCSSTKGRRKKVGEEKGGGGRMGRRNGTNISELFGILVYS